MERYRVFLISFSSFEIREEQLTAKESHPGIKRSRKVFREEDHPPGRKQQKVVAKTFKMVIKVYISGMSGSKEVKKRQQRVTMILDSKHIPYTIIDITEPGQEQEKDFMQKNSEHNGSTISDPTPRHPLPPQMFNDAEYCGDYDDFDLANEVDNLEVFLKLEAPKPAAAPVSDEVSPAADEQKNGQEDQSGDQVTATEAAAAADDDENKENKTEEGANEDDVSGKLVDTDDPMLAEQEQEE